MIGRLLQLIRSHIRYKIIMPYLALTIFVMLAGAAIVLFLVAANAQDVLTNQLANNARIVSARGHPREWTSLDRLERWLRGQGFRYWWMANELDAVGEAGDEAAEDTT